MAEKIQSGWKLVESFLRVEESLRWEGFVNECPNTVFHDSGLQSLQFVSEDTINSWKKKS